MPKAKVRQIPMIFPISIFRNRFRGLKKRKILLKICEKIRSDDIRSGMIIISMTAAASTPHKTAPVCFLRASFAGSSVFASVFFIL